MKAVDKGESNLKAEICPRTRRALLAMNLTSEPLSAFYTLLPIILYKHLHVTPFELSLFITLRPLFSVFSFYWSSYLLYYRNRLVSNLIGAWTLARLPFVLLLFFPNFWVLFFAAAFYQLFSKAGTPAWIEILNRNIPKEPREHLFSVYNILSFLEGIGISFIIGRLLDHNPGNWNIILCCGAFIGLANIYFLKRVKIPFEEDVEGSLPKNPILHPWKEGFQLMQNRLDFARFQWGFMFGGGALMIAAPALSVFYSDNLAISYTNMTFARFVFMGIGVILSSLIWKKGLKLLPINILVLLSLVGFGLFLGAILLAQIDGVFLYLAFLVYGIAQAGSQLIWNLSGTIFANEKNSLPFTNVNILMLGIRGCVAPLIGGQLCVLFGAVPTIFIGISIIICGVFYLLRKEASSLLKPLDI